MSLECSECENDLRGGHDPSCSRYVADSPEAARLREANWLGQSGLARLRTIESAPIEDHDGVAIAEIRVAELEWLCAIVRAVLGSSSPTRAPQWLVEAMEDLTTRTSYGIDNGEAFDDAMARADKILLRLRAGPTSDTPPQADDMSAKIIEMFTPSLPHSCCDRRQKATAINIADWLGSAAADPRHGGPAPMTVQHVCRESETCTCYALADEPKPDCPVHGFPWPPRCAECGHFLPRSVRSPQQEG